MCLFCGASHRLPDTDVRHIFPVNTVSSHRYIWILTVLFWILIMIQMICPVINDCKYICIIFYPCKFWWVALLLFVLTLVAYIEWILDGSLLFWNLSNQKNIANEIAIKYAKLIMDAKWSIYWTMYSYHNEEYMDRRVSRGQSTTPDRIYYVKATRRIKTHKAKKIYHAGVCIENSGFSINFFEEYIKSLPPSKIVKILFDKELRFANKETVHDHREKLKQFLENNDRDNKIEHYVENTGPDKFSSYFVASKRQIAWFSKFYFWISVCCLVIPCYQRFIFSSISVDRLLSTKTFKFCKIFDCIFGYELLIYGYVRQYVGYDMFDDIFKIILQLYISTQRFSSSKVELDLVGTNIPCKIDYDTKQQRIPYDL